MQIPDVPPQLLAALVEAAAGQRLALVGGVVRDLLLHRRHQDPWRGLPDLDLVVEGRAADLVERLPQALEQHLGQPVAIRQQQHGRYGTVALELDLPAEFGGLWLLDLASARRESYPEPAMNPEVSPGTLEEDLARRDFTVNAMALEFVPGQLADARLLDPHGGQSDLAQRQLRFLHPGSLRDDPTRVVRAARYSARLGFVLAPEALAQIQTTVSVWPWHWRPGDSPAAAPAALATRLRMELELLLQREPWPQALLLLQKWGAMALFDETMQKDEQWRLRLRCSPRLKLPLLLAMVASASDPVGLALRLQLPQGRLRRLTSAVELCARLQELKDFSKGITLMPSGWCSILEAPRIDPEVVSLAVIMGARPRKSLLHWLYCWRHVKSPQSARTLLDQGWLSGPKLGEELKRRRYAELDSNFS
jgi:poly(A) polymerase